MANTTPIKFYNAAADGDVFSPMNVTKSIMTVNAISITGNEENSDSLYIIAGKSYMSPEKFSVCKINSYWYMVTGHHRVWIDDVFTPGIRIDLQKNLLETGIRNLIINDYSFYLRQPGNLTLGQTEAPPWPYDPAFDNTPMSSFEMHSEELPAKLNIVAMAPEYSGDHGNASHPIAFSLGEETDLNGLHVPNHNEGDGGTVLATFFNRCASLEQMLSGATIEYGFTNLSFKFPEKSFITTKPSDDMFFQDANILTSLSKNLPAMLKMRSGFFRCAIGNEYSEIKIDPSIPDVLDRIEIYKDNLGIINRIRIGLSTYPIPHGDISAPINQVLADSLRLSKMGDVTFDQVITGLGKILADLASKSLGNTALAAIGGLVGALIPPEYQTNFGYVMMKAMGEDDMMTQQQEALLSQGISGGILINSAAEFSYNYQIPQVVGRVPDLSVFKITASNLFSADGIGIMKRSAEIAQSVETDVPDAYSAALQWIESGFYCNSGQISSTPTDPVDTGDVPSDAPEDITTSDAYKSGLTAGGFDKIGSAKGKSIQYAQKYVKYYGLDTIDPVDGMRNTGTDDWSRKLESKYGIPADIGSDRSPLFKFAYGYRDKVCAIYTKNEKDYRAPFSSPEDLFSNEAAEKALLEACDKFIDGNPDATKQP